MIYNTKILKYSEIINYDFKCSEPTLFVVYKNNVKYDLLIKFNPQYKNLICLNSGAYDKNACNLPVFHRLSWNNEIPASLIYCNDPTLYLGDIKLGWFYGEQSNHYLTELANILTYVSASLNYNLSDAIFYGSSAGGFASIMLATILKGKAVVNNAQTDILKFWPTPIAALKKAVLKEGEDFIKSRTSLINFFKINKYIPKIHFYQNLASSFDMKNMVLPFLTELCSLSSSPIRIYDCNFYYYYQSIDNQDPHNPLDKAQTIEILKKHLTYPLV